MTYCRSRLWNGKRLVLQSLKSTFSQMLQAFSITLLTSDVFISIIWRYTWSTLKEFRLLCRTRQLSLLVWGRSTSASSCVQRHKKPRIKVHYALLYSSIGRLEFVTSIGVALVTCTPHRPSKVNQLYRSPEWRISSPRQTSFSWICVWNEAFHHGRVFDLSDVKFWWTTNRITRRYESRSHSYFLDFQSHFGAMTTWHLHRIAS